MAFLSQNLIPSLLLIQPFSAHLETSSKLQFANKNATNTPVVNELTIARDQLISRLMPLNKEMSTTTTSSTSMEEDLEKLLNRYFSLLYGFIYPVVSYGTAEESTMETTGETIASPVEISSALQGSSTLVMTKNNSDENNQQEEKTGDASAPSLVTQYSKFRSSIQYVWTLDKTKAVVSDTLWEVICMCVAYAIKLKTVAENHVLRTEQSYNVKRAYQLLLKASSVLQFANHLTQELDLNHVPALSFFLTMIGKQNVVYILLQATLAEAQEMALLVSLEKLDDKPQLVAKVAKNVVEKYETAYNCFAPSNESAAWFTVLHYKAQYYDALFHVYAAVSFNKEDENGVALAYVNHAESLNSKLAELVKKVVNQAELKPYKQTIEARTKFLSGLLSRYKSKFQSENSMVYHQKVPTEIPAENQIAGQSLGKVTMFEYPKHAPEWNEQLYNSLNMTPIASQQKPNSTTAPAQARDTIMEQIEVQSIGGKQPIDTKASTNNRRTTRDRNEDGFSLCNIL